MTRVLLTAIIMLTFSVPVTADNTYTFAVVPQQAAKKLARTWIPILKYVEKDTGIKFEFKTESSIPEFENKLSKGEYDFAYMNPYHYVVFHEKSAYQAFAKAKDKKIRGIIVASKSSGITDIKQLNGAEIAFPSPAAFAASILTRSFFTESGITIVPKYVNSHDSVYTNVALGRYKAGGGVKRTLNAASQQYRDNLKIIHTTNGFTPHAFAAHARISTKDRDKVRRSLQSLENAAMGKKLLSTLKIKGIEQANDSDWNDIRALKIDILK